MLSRRCLPALVAGLALLWTAGPRTGAADEASDRIERLVKQLGSNKFADRERAKRELQAIGTPALEALKKAAGDDGEMGRRARDLARELEQKAVTERVLGGKKVKLTFKDTPVIDAVDELVRQSGYNIQIQGEVATLAKRKVTLDTGDTTFWPAFDQLCLKAGLVEIPSQPQAAPADPFLQNPRLNPGRMPVRPLQIRPVPRIQPGKRPAPGLPGALKLDGPARLLGAADQPAPAPVLVQAQFGRPGRNEDEQIKQLQQLQKLMEKQMAELLQRLEKEFQQLQQGGRPGQFQPLLPKGMQKDQQKMLRDLLRQLQQMQRLQGNGQLPQFQAFPQPRGRFRPELEQAEPEIRQINVKDGTPQPVPTAYVGALRLRLLPTGEGKRDGEAGFNLEVSVEPKVYAFTPGDGSRVQRAVDDLGQELTGTLASNLRAVRDARGVFSVNQPILQVKLGEKEAKALKELRGELAGQVLAQSDPLIVVPDIFNAVGKTSRGAQGGSIEVLGVEKKGDGEVQVQIRLESPPFHADGTRATSLPTLVDAKGEGYQLVQVPSRSRRTNGRVVTQELTLLYRANPGQGDPSRLVLNGVRPVTVQVPFAFQNVPLP
jgi:hypothetical protein